MFTSIGFRETADRFNWVFLRASEEIYTQRNVNSCAVEDQGISEKGIVSHYLHRKHELEPGCCSFRHVCARLALGYIHSHEKRVTDPRLSRVHEIRDGGFATIRSTITIPQLLRIWKGRRLGCGQVFGFCLLFSLSSFCWVLLLIYGLQNDIEAETADGEAQHFVIDFLSSILLDALVNQPILSVLQDLVIMRIIMYYYVPDTPEMKSHKTLVNAAFIYARLNNSLHQVGKKSLANFSAADMRVLPSGSVTPSSEQKLHEIRVLLSKLPQQEVDATSQLVAHGVAQEKVRALKSVRNASLHVLLAMTVAATVFGSLESWSVGDSIWFAFVTLTTIGSYSFI